MVTGQGHTQLIGRHFGRFWAWFSVLTLLVCCMGALMTELAGLAGVGALLNLPASLTMILVVGTLLLMAYTHSYLSVERIAIALGATAKIQEFSSSSRGNCASSSIASPAIE